MTRPAQTPWGEVIPLRHVEPLSPYRMARATNDKEMLDAILSYDESEGYGQTTIERSYARQGKRFPDQPDLNQLKLRVHPPIAWWEVAIMCVVAAFIGVMLATGGVL